MSQNGFGGESPFCFLLRPIFFRRELDVWVILLCKNTLLSTCYENYPPDYRSLVNRSNRQPLTELFLTTIEGLKRVPKPVCIPKVVQVPEPVDQNFDKAVPQRLGP